MHKISINVIFLPVQPYVPHNLYSLHSIFLTKLHAHIKQILLKYFRNSLLKTWVESDLDPREFKEVIRTSAISEF